MLQCLARLGQEPCIFHCDHRLRGEVFQQRDLFLGKRPHFPANGDDHPEERVVLTQGDVKQSAVASLNRDTHYIPQFRAKCRYLRGFRLFELTRSDKSPSIPPNVDLRSVPPHVRHDYGVVKLIIPWS